LVVLSGRGCDRRIGFRLRRSVGNSGTVGVWVSIRNLGKSGLADQDEHKRQNPSHEQLPSGLSELVVRKREVEISTTNRLDSVGRLSPQEPLGIDDLDDITWRQQGNKAQQQAAKHDQILRSSGGHFCDARNIFSSASTLQ
jgi:hypothetical protein